jgi:hypothetical protein
MFWVQSPFPVGFQELRKMIEADGYFLLGLAGVLGGFLFAWVICDF